MCKDRGGFPKVLADATGVVTIWIAPVFGAGLEKIMYVERSRTRISPRDFIDYVVSIQIGAVEYQGFLGNISENGLCAIIPHSGAVDAPAGVSVSGRVVSRRLEGPLSYKGRAAWQSSSQIHNQPHVLIGVEFEKTMSLPDPLLALGMSTDSE